MLQRRKLKESCKDEEIKKTFRERKKEMTHEDGQMFCTFHATSSDEKRLFSVELIKDKVKSLFKGTRVTTTSQLREGHESYRQKSLKKAHTLIFYKYILLTFSIIIFLSVCVSILVGRTAVQPNFLSGINKVFLIIQARSCTSQLRKASWSGVCAWCEKDTMWKSFPTLLRTGRPHSTPHFSCL